MTTVVFESRSGNRRPMWSPTMPICELPGRAVNLKVLAREIEAD